MSSGRVYEELIILLNTASQAERNVQLGALKKGSYRTEENKR
jgi:hypothetical protein